MEFQEFSKETIKQIDKQLSQLLKEWRSEVDKIDTKLLPLVDKFIAGCSGGKKLRGVLVVLGYELAKQATGNRFQVTDKEIFKIAAAYEILHSAVLVHDDVIDQSPKRRGIHSLYKAIGGGHYGVSQAISLGDAGFFLGFKIISESNFPQKSKISALKLFSKVMLDTALGEILDLEKADPLVVMKLKTAYYTISGPLQLGAILGGLGPASLRILGMRDFGESLGIAFQIKDDILDSESVFWGGVENAKKEAEKYKNQAMKIQPGITKDPKMSKILEQMAGYLVERNK